MSLAPGSVQSSGFRRMRVGLAGAPAGWGPPSSTNDEVYVWVDPAPDGRPGNGTGYTPLTPAQISNLQLESPDGGYGYIDYNGVDATINSGNAVQILSLAPEVWSTLQAIAADTAAGIDPNADPAISAGWALAQQAAPPPPSAAPAGPSRYFDDGILYDDTGAILNPTTGAPTGVTLTSAELSSLMSTGQLPPGDTGAAAAAVAEAYDAVASPSAAAAIAAAQSGDTTNGQPAAGGPLVSPQPAGGASQSAPGGGLSLIEWGGIAVLGILVVRAVRGRG